MSKRRSEGVEAGPAGRGRPAGIADLLGKGLGGLEPGRRRRGAEDRDARCPQPVRDTGREGGLWPHDHQIDSLFPAEGDHRIAVKDVESGTFGDGRKAGIARRRDQPVAFGVLAHGPAQGMLTPATAQDQDVHGPRAPLFLGRGAF